MYAWCVAVHKHKVQLVHELSPKSRLISQPPHNWELGQAAMLHYTWGALFFKNEKEIWRFDKRDWTAKEHELKVSMIAHYFALPGLRHHARVLDCVAAANTQLRSTVLGSDHRAVMQVHVEHPVCQGATCTCLDPTALRCVCLCCCRFHNSSYRRSRGRSDGSCKTACVSTGTCTNC